MRIIKVQLDFLWKSPSRVRHRRGVAAQGCFLVTSAALAWSAYLHYYLWHKLGYRQIPAIGTLFLVHAALGGVLAVLVALVQRVWTILAAALFALLTLASFLVAVDHGLFGFRESWAAPDARSAFLSDVLVVVFALSAARLTLVRIRPQRRSHANPISRPPTGLPRRRY